MHTQLQSLGEHLTLREARGGGTEGSEEPRSQGASRGRQQALNGRLLLQETFRAWEAFVCLSSQGCFSKDFQVFLSS